MKRALPGDMSIFYQMFNLEFDGYGDEISQVVRRTFDNSPRTASSVREILTPRPEQDPNPFPRSPRKSRSPLSSRSLPSTGSSWPDFTSSAPEVSFLDLKFEPSPRSSRTELPPYSSRTPRSARYGVSPLEIIPERTGSDLSLDELRRHKLNERSLPTPRTPLPGRKENGVHIPYLDLPATSRSNTLVNMNDFLSTLLSGYRSSQGTTLQGSLPATLPPPSQGGGEEKWTKKEKMLLAGLIFVGLIVLLLAVIVVLVAFGIVDKDDTPSYSSNGDTNTNMIEQFNSTSDGTGSAINGNQYSNAYNSNKTSNLQPNSSYELNDTAISSNTEMWSSTPSFIKIKAPLTTAAGKTPVDLSSGISRSKSGTTRKPPENQQFSQTTRKTSVVTTTTKRTTTESTKTPTTKTTKPTTSTKTTTTKKPTTPTTTTTTTTKKTTTTSTTTTTTTTKKPTTASTTTTTTTTTTTPEPTTTTSSTTSPPTTTTKATTTTTTTEHPLAKLVETTCTSERCQQLSDVIKSSMGNSALTCSAFHKFACDGQATSGQRYFHTDSMTPLHQLVSNDLYELAIDVLSNLEPQTQSDNEKVSGALYRTCILSNTQESQDAAYQDILEMMDGIVLSPTFNISLSLDLLLRRVQDRFGVTPLFNMRRTPVFDGSAYEYITRISPPSLTLSAEEYTVALNQSEMGQRYIETVSMLLEDILRVGNQGRRKRNAKNDDVNRTRRQAENESSLVREKVKKTFELEWKIAELTSSTDVNVRSQFPSTVKVRNFQVQVSELPWIFLTDLSTIDEIHVLQKEFFISLNDLLKTTDIDDLKLYVYIRTLVSLFPYMPANFRKNLASLETGIQEIYTPLDCSRLTFQTAFEETMTLVMESNAELFKTEREFSITAANEAKEDLMRAFGGYKGTSRDTITKIMTYLSSLNFRQMSVSAPSGILHSARSLLTTTSSLLEVARAISAHKRSHFLATTFDSSGLNEITATKLDFELSVGADGQNASVPLGLIHLGAWTKEPEFLIEFYKTFIYRDLLKYIFKKFVYNEEFSDLNQCSMARFPDLESTQDLQDDGRDIEIAVLVEVAVQALIHKDSQVSTSVAVKLGTNYFYQQQFTYQAYVQPFCISSEVDTMLWWLDTINPRVLINRTVNRDYKSSVSYRCEPKACFFWAQQLSTGEEAPSGA